MSENTHHARAMSRLHNGTTNEVARAQAEATLALAHEQRTANLISAFAHLRDHEGITMLGDAYPLFNQIKERLGLA